MTNTQSKPKRMCILGTRGIPARHGGFETFAEQLALYLCAKGWDVTVYCQVNATEPKREIIWQGVRLVHIPSGDDSPLATIIFDLKAVLDAAKRGALVLTLGYNTAIFLLWFKLMGVPNLINMDGIEWKRSKWSFPARCWLFMNERMAAWFANHLVADHPQILAHHAKHTRSSKITMIPYGAPLVPTARQDTVCGFGLKPDEYVLVVARAEPENSILEIVQSFCAKKRHCKLAIVGNYHPDQVPYHAKVIAAANEDVMMLGAEYDHSKLSALRFHAKLYVHGHQVGGTNPSLVEALGASNAILAHDNAFNRWVAGPGSAYFHSIKECTEKFDALLENPHALRQMREASRRRHSEKFQWPDVLAQYEQLLLQWTPANAEVARTRTSADTETS